MLVEVLIIAGGSFCIFYVWSHIETYFATHKTFRIPTWIAKARNAMLVAHLVIATALFATHMAIQQSNVEPVLFVFSGVQGICLGSSMFVAVHKIAKALVEFRNNVDSRSVCVVWFYRILASKSATCYVKHCVR